ARWQEGGQEAVARLGAELELVEQRVDIGPLGQVPGKVVDLNPEVEVPGQLGDPPVELDLREVLPETLPDLSLDLVGVRDELRERAVLHDPLGGRLVPHLA